MRVSIGKTALLLTLVVCIALPAQDLKPIQLPAPQMDGGRPLMQVLKERKTQREFSSEKLPCRCWPTSYGLHSGLTLPMADALHLRR